MKKHLPLIFLIIILIGWAFTIDQTVNHFIFQPTYGENKLRLPFERITFEAENRQKMKALYLPAKEDKPTVLFFHGNKYNIYAFEDLAEAIHAEGYGFFLFDYRGYGLSEGYPSEKHFYEDAQSALQYLLTQKKIKPENIILWGFSLGNAPALHLASRFNSLPFYGVIAQSPFTNTADMAVSVLSKDYNNSPKEQAAAEIMRIFLWHKIFDNTKTIGKVESPLLIGYSKQDRVIPWTISEKLASRAPKATRYISDTGIHHSFDWFIPRVLLFLKDIKNPSEKEPSDTPTN